MRKHLWWIIGALLLFSITVISWTPSSAIKTNKISDAKTLGAKELFAQYVADIYNTANLQQTGMNMAVLQKAVTGYLNLKLANKLHDNSNIITVIDFTRSSREKRMWIIDILNKSLILNTWVAHGQGSGDDMASRFSNSNESHQSSLGFYLASEVYFGKHGRSLKLDGLDAGINSAARARGIVVHAADYVSQGTINQLGRLGRSFGCPAVSTAVSDKVINTIKGGSVLYINGNDTKYTSKLLDENAAANFFGPDNAAAIAKL
ncbi:murein L,D-transpeptidase catalytic domain family protein [Mucilaginibacter sp. 14171R-50]|uniref:murein L,D-transpeptidase catalytic domain family protein n=1 Tax=Mucilaginibacter sp. 14171R-50 TaxID=2703789 RepID=UPI00138D754F|nr:murein L,D-transpeptidase catalytic domain family protein [Mucilaginibacter sp. 14171R-50]QHS56368.1 murein L,D-transpeptidase catalytic domain family protein [Mucilaginibacter sp. 14171R-50]